MPERTMMPKNNPSPSITIKKKRKGLSKKIHKLSSRLHSSGNHTLQNLIKYLRGTRSNHLIITGYSPKSINLLFDLICRNIDDKTKIVSHSIPATETVSVYSRNLLTKCPEDILNIETISSTFKSYRDIRFVVVIDDPRHVVTEKMPGLPHQYYQGYDYQLFMDNAIKSLTSPGLGAKHEAYRELINSDHTFATIRAEELATIADLGKNLSDWAFYQKRPWQTCDDTHQATIHRNTPCKNSHNAVPKWLHDEEALAHLSNHLALFPEVENIAQELGYPPISDLISKPFSDKTDTPLQKTGTIVLFHTDDEIYREEARRCINSIESIGLEYDLTVIPPKSSWVENCALKPKILSEARQRIKGPILYIDVDAVVHKNPWPYLSQYDGDMAVYVHQNGELISSAIYLNDTPEALEILDRWVELQNRNRHVWDQRVLQEIMEDDEKGAKRYRIQRLPPNFTYIFDKRYPYIHGDILIEQLQASREIKKENKKALERRKKRLKNL